MGIVFNCSVYIPKRDTALCIFDCRFLEGRRWKWCQGFWVQSLEERLNQSRYPVCTQSFKKLFLNFDCLHNFKLNQIDSFSPLSSLFH